MQAQKLDSICKLLQTQNSQTKTTNETVEKIKEDSERLRTDINAQKVIVKKIQEAQCEEEILKRLNSIDPGIKISGTAEAKFPDDNNKDNVRKMVDYLKPPIHKNGSLEERYVLQFMKKENISDSELAEALNTINASKYVRGYGSSRKIVFALKPEKEQKKAAN